MRVSLLKKAVASILLLIPLLIPLRSLAGIIDFEVTSSAETPTDNGIIHFNDDFIADGVAVRFGFDSNFDGILDTKAVFEQAGNKDAGKDTGFVGFAKGRDQAAPPFESLLGDFFLRQSEPYKPFGVFTILYNANSPVTQASGEIWDIDGKKNKTERFLVKAFNDTELLAIIESPLGIDSTLNGKPWIFGFTGLSDITKIEITFTGSKTQGIGLAFNNFSPVENISHAIHQIPIPATVYLFMLGLMGITTRQLK